MADSKAPTFYLNLYTNDPKAALEFYKALDFTPAAAWCDDKTSSLTFPAPNLNMALMLHHPSRMKEFIRPNTEVGDATKTTPGLYSIAARSKEEVDATLAKAVGAGGKADPFVMEKYGEPMGMYSRSFEDLDGHIWEAVYMNPDASST